MELFFVRHGETVWNREKRLQGRLDSPLTPRGIKLAMGYGERIRSRLGPRAPRAEIHASPLGRTLQTAAILADLIGVERPVVVEERLVEHDVGSFSGKTWAEIEAEQGYTRKDFLRWDRRSPGGESRQDMQARSASWLADRPRNRPVIVVSHGGLSRAFRAAFLAIDDGAKAQALPTHDHGRFYLCVEGPPPRVEEVESPAGEARPEAALG